MEAKSNAARFIQRHASNSRKTFYLMISTLFYIYDTISLWISTPRKHEPNFRAILAGVIHNKRKFRRHQRARVHAQAVITLLDKRLLFIREHQLCIRSKVVTACGVGCNLSAESNSQYTGLFSIGNGVRCACDTIVFIVCWTKFGSSPWLVSIMVFRRSFDIMSSRNMTISFRQYLIRHGFVMNHTRPVFEERGSCRSASPVRTSNFL